MGNISSKGCSNDGKNFTVKQETRMKIREGRRFVTCTLCILNKTSINRSFLIYDVSLIVFFISFVFIHSLAAVGPHQEFSQFRHGYLQSTTHRVKKVREFPVPSRDVTTKLSRGGNNDVITELFLPRRSLVSDIPAGDGKLVNLFHGAGTFLTGRGLKGV